MKKVNKNRLIIVVIIIFIIIGNYLMANSYYTLLNYNEENYATTQFVVDVKDKKSLSGYYLINDKYYKDNKSKSKEWIKEDIKVKKLGNQYCEPRIELLKSIKNLDQTKEIPASEDSDMSMIFIMQRDKIFSDKIHNCYDGLVSIYLDQNIISIDAFGKQGSTYYIPKKEKYYIMDDKIKENVDKIIDQVLNENKY